MRHDPLEIHASDRDECLARFRAEVIDGLDSVNSAGKVGTAIHRVAEAITLEMIEHPMADARDVAAAEFTRAVKELDIPPGGVVDGLAILDKVLAFDSRIALRVEMGWSGRPEVKWALDDEFKIVQPCAMCSGSAVEDRDVGGVAGERPCRGCVTDGHPGWSRPTLAAGTIDLLEWTPTKQNLRVTDWKTERAFRDADDAFEDWQSRLYVFAALQMFPEAQVVEFRFGMLRHGYFARAEFMRGDPWQWTVKTRLRAIREQRERAVASNVWPETPGPWCGWCPIMHRCASLEAVRAVGTVPPDLDVAELARRWKGLTKLADDYGDEVKARFQLRDDAVPLGDAKGTVLGLKPVAGWSCVHEYEETLERVRELVPAGAWPTVFAENFRFIYETHFASKVQKVLKSLKVSDDVMDSIVVPVTKTQLTTFRPDPPAEEEFVADEDSIAAALKADPERVRRALEEMK